MAIYYIADMHLGHRKCIVFDKRPFGSVDEMDECLIANWQARVRRDDHVYVLGDMFHKAGDAAEDTLRRLPGIKHLVIGNNDRKWMKAVEVRDWFCEAAHIINIKDEGRRVCLCHYPMAEWSRRWRGGWHIYGHIHAGTYSPVWDYILTQDHMLNAFCGICDWRPATFDELVEANARFKALHPQGVPRSVELREGDVG